MRNYLYLFLLISLVTACRRETWNKLLWKKAIVFVMLSFGLLSCSVKTVAYRPDLKMSIQPDAGISGIRVGEFENQLGLKDPKKINRTMALNREVAEVIRDAMVKELNHNNIDTNSGRLIITGDIQQLDPLKIPVPVARIVYRLNDASSGQTLHEFTCESDPAARRIEPAIQNCIAQFFSTRDIALALNLEDKPSVVTAAKATPIKFGRSINYWKGTNGVLEIYAGEKLVKRFLNIEELFTSFGTSRNFPSPYCYSYGYLDENFNMQKDAEEKKVYFEFNGYATNYIFFEKPQ